MEAELKIEDFGKSLKEATTFEQLIDITQRELDKYDAFLKEFFTSKRNELTAIYTGIKNNSYPYNELCTTDLPKITNDYSDYFIGLLEFGNKITMLRDSDEISADTISDTISKVSERDNDFVHALFDDCVDKHASIDKAACNLDLIKAVSESISNYKSGVISIIQKAIKNDCKKYRSQILEGLKVVAHSVISYNLDTVCDLAKTFSDIMLSMKNRTPVGGAEKPAIYSMY